MRRVSATDNTLLYIHLPGPEARPIWRWITGRGHPPRQKFETGFGASEDLDLTSSPHRCRQRPVLRRPPLNSISFPGTFAQPSVFNTVLRKQSEEENIRSRDAPAPAFSGDPRPPSPPLSSRIRNASPSPSQADEDYLLIAFVRSTLRVFRVPVRSRISAWANRSSQLAS